jgi:hypothetical protein
MSEIFVDIPGRDLRPSRAARHTTSLAGQLVKGAGSLQVIATLDAASWLGAGEVAVVTGIRSCRPSPSWRQVSGS